jgi:hypothetical protein
MGYQLRLHREIRDWLTDLRDTEPELARRGSHESNARTAP